MEIIKLVFMETNGLGVDIPSRPYELDLRMDSSEIIESLDEMTMGGVNINSASISRLASGILVPSNKPRHTNIDGGWREKRIIFSMVVGVQESSRYREVRYISGYTDRSDYTVDSRGRVHFPDDMRLYFNSVAKVSLMEVASRGGNMIRPAILDNNLMLRKDSIVSDDHDDYRRGRRGDTPMLLRPSDILKRQGSNRAISSFTSEVLAPTVSNTIGKFSLNTQMSKRRNNNSADHMTDTIKKYIEARATMEDSSNTSIVTSHDDSDYMTYAAGLLKESTAGEDVFFHELKSFSDIIRTGYIEWYELMTMDPEFEQHGDFPFITWDAQVKSSNRNRRDGGEHTRGTDKYFDTASFYETTLESTCALMIAQSLPEILSNAMYSGVKGLVINSHPQHGEPSCHISMPFPFVDGIPVKYGYNYFVSQINNVVIPNITKNGTFQVEAMVNASIDTDIEIWITVDGGPEEYFAWPSWAEALTAPVVTNDERDLDVISDGVAGLVEDFALKIERDRPGLLQPSSTKDIFAGKRKLDSFEATPSEGRSERNYGDIDLGL